MDSEIGGLVVHAKRPPRVNQPQGRPPEQARHRGPQLFAANGVTEEIGTGRTVGVKEGTETAKAWKAAFPNAHGTVENRVVSGNQAIGEILWTGTNSGSLNGMPPTNKQANVRAVAVITEEGGKIAKVRHYIDVAGACVLRGRLVLKACRGDVVVLRRELHALNSSPQSAQRSWRSVLKRTRGECRWDSPLGLLRRSSLPVVPAPPSVDVPADEEADHPKKESREQHIPQYAHQEPAASK
jgi:predicted ester cyclase